MRTATLAACLALTLPLHTLAQSGNPDLSAMPEVMKNLKWKSIDPAAFTPVERCRVLQFMNDALTEISNRAGAEADLMSAFIDQHDLGPQFAAAAPAAPSTLTFDDAQRISAAMIKGPLASSSYATDYADVDDPNFFNATIALFDSSSRRKWSEVVESRTQTQNMSRFITDQKLADAYQAWAPGEVQRREEAYQAEVATKRAADAEKRKAEQAQRQADAKDAAELQAQREKEDAAAEAKSMEAKKQLEASGQMQQALGAAQQDQPILDGDDDSVAWYPAWGYAGAAYLNSANWYRDGAYHGAAAATVNNRYNDWHRGARSGGLRRGGGRR